MERRGFLQALVAVPAAALAVLHGRESTASFKKSELLARACDGECGRDQHETHGNAGGSTLVLHDSAVKHFDQSVNGEEYIQHLLLTYPGLLAINCSRKLWSKVIDNDWIVMRAGIANCPSAEYHRKDGVTSVACGRLTAFPDLEWIITG